MGESDLFEEWLIREIERARQLLVENPVNTRKVLERVLAQFRKMNPEPDPTI